MRTRIWDLLTLLGLSMAVAAVVAAAPVAVRLADAASAPSTPEACETANATPSAPVAAGATVVAVATAAPEPAQAGDIPDSQAFVTYASSAGGYSIQMPEGWARVDQGPNVDFTDKTHEFSVQILCATSAPTVESAKATDVPALSRSVPAFTLLDVRSVALPAGPAVLIRYQANSKPDDVTGKQHRLDVERYELRKGGRMAVITLAVPAGSDNADVAKQVTESFTWTA